MKREGDRGRRPVDAWARDRERGRRRHGVVAFDAGHAQPLVGLGPAVDFHEVENLKHHCLYEYRNAVASFIILDKIKEMEI